MLNKYVVVLVLCFGSFAVAGVDTLLVDEIVKEYDPKLYSTSQIVVFLQAGGKVNYDVWVIVPALYHYIYQRKFAQNGLSFRQFLFNLLDGKLLISENEIKQAGGDEPVKETKIWRSRKKGIKYLISQYTCSQMGLLFPKTNLSWDERLDLARVMFRNGYFVRNGELSFYKPPYKNK